MSKSLILKEIFSQNKHWENEDSFFEHKKQNRMLFFELLKYLDDQQILSIVGLRRTGKTVLLKQLIKYLITKKNIDTKDILFLSFDEALITSKLTLKDYLDEYLKNIASESDNKKYIFLDEIQYIEKWQHILKRYYDNNPNIKFIISGSSSLFLKKKTTESLAGRIYEFKLLPLSFAGFLRLSAVDKKILTAYQKYSLMAGETKLSYKQNKYEIFLAQYGDRLQKMFENYLLYYQFPEMLKQSDTLKIKKYISESIYKKAIEYDIPRIFGVEKVDELKFLFQMLVNENGSLIEFQTIASEIGIEENTLKKYISYFQESFLFDLVYNYSKSFRKSKRLQKKGYVSSSNFFAVFRSDWSENQMLKSEYFGILAETYVFNLLKEKYQYISFYRKNQNEIDFIVSNDYRNMQKQVPIEVKYTNTIRWNDLKFIDKTAKNVFKRKYLVYSKNELKNDDNKLVIPCFLIKDK